jgi:nucleotide-binding universal stress UspA family protein
MFKRILVPLDGTSRAERVLPVAAHLAGASAGSLILLQVVNPVIDYGMYLTQPPVLTRQEIAARFTEATHYLARLAQSEDLEGFGVQTAVLSGAVAPTLFSYAQSCQADLIVLCSHGYIGFKRWFLGSVADCATRATPVPVLVVRDGGPLPAAPRPASGHPISALVALDGSMFAETALEPAANLVAALAAPAQGALHLARVVDILKRYHTGKSSTNIGMEMMEQARREAETYLISVVDQLQAGIASRLNLSLSASVVSDANVAGAIIKAGEGVEEDGGYAFLAMSTHGRSGLERLAMGSVTERVLHGSRLPLLIVRPGDAVTKKEATEDETSAIAERAGQTWVGLL